MEKTEKTGKSGLIKSAQNLIVKKQELSAQIRNLRLEYQKLSGKYQPQINELQIKAEDLAKEFRRLYSESKEAYSSGDGALAKSLSLTGYAVENRCRAINSQANFLRNELKAILKQIEKLRQKAEECQIQADKHYKQADEMRKTYVKSFGLSKIISDDDVEKFLDEFPQKIFEKILSIRFEDKVIINEPDVTFGNHDLDRKSGKFEIKIYQHTSEKDLKETIAHEIGHTIFRSFMKDIPDRWQWGNWYQESMKTKNFITGYDPGTREEDFCECFVQFKTNPKYLEKFDKRRYDFINKIYQDIEQGKNL